MVCTLVCRIDVHAYLLILRKKSSLHGLILVYTFINFEKKFPPAHLFHPARLLLMVDKKFFSYIYVHGWKGSLNLIEVFQSIPKVSQSIPKHFQSIAKALPKHCQSIAKALPKHCQSNPKVFYIMLRKKSLLQGLILVCRFIDFGEKFPPARLFWPAHLIFFKNFSNSTFILPCKSIRHTRVGTTSFVKGVRL